jgi:O2-independent ubiquinone biosynthesis protein UbiU
VCPAGTPAALTAAIEAGADTVYLGFRDATNARNFPGLNFSRDEFSAGVTGAHKAGRKIYVAINTYPKAGDPGPWRRAVDDAAVLGADAIIVADVGLLEYAAKTYPDLRRHLSVQASASNAESIGFFQREFGVQRVVLPRVLTVNEVRDLTRDISVETEVFAFGGMCVMAEGRCQLSSYITGRSPNLDGVCSPADAVRYEPRGDRMACTLGGYTLDVVAKDEPAGYPTLCKGRFQAKGSASYLFEEPTSLDAMALLPDLANAGVTAIKIEGRQRGRAYVSRVVSAFRAALDGANSNVDPANLDDVSEGMRGTSGAYRKVWQ